MIHIIKNGIEMDCGTIRIGLRFGGRKFIAGIVLALVSIAGCFLVSSSAVITIVFAVMFLGVSLLYVDTSRGGTIVLYSVWGLGTTIVVLFMMQLMLNEGTLSLGVLRIVLGVVCVGVLLLICILATANIRISVIITAFILMLFTAANYFVFKFRGSELSPADFLFLGTAADVANRYQFSVNKSFVFSGLIMALWCFVGFCLPVMKIKRRIKRALCGIAVLAVMTAVVVIGSRNIVPYHFMQSGSVSNGYLLNFLLEIRENAVEKPEGYSVDAVNSIVSRYAPNETADAESRRPDIIVIMNESFTNLGYLGSDLRTNIPVTPFFDSLSENTIRGEMLSSVFGGGTPNSEYEFLSGNTMGFLPYGSIVYQQFIHEPAYTACGYLESLGYHTIATHPFTEKNWLRDRIYPLFSFDEMYFETDYPNENLIRGFVSDREMYEYIVSLYENRGQDAPLFLFGITMQNHGFYEYEGDDFITEISLEGYKGEYPDVEQFLTLLHYSDQAMEWLIRYFESVEDDVVIVFYGDHFPKLDDRFYEEVHGGAFDTLDEQMCQYTVPFIIWANYDIEEEYIERSSINYLSGYMYEAAGLPEPAYNQFLANVQKTIPALNAHGYYSAEQGEYIPFDEAEGTEKELLNEYKILEYNSLFDSENTSSVFFPLPEEDRPTENRTNGRD